MSSAERPPTGAAALRREQFTVLRPVPTRWADVDVYGHVNNVVHYSMMDTAVNGWLIEATDTDIRRLDATGWVVETSCRYLAQLHFPSTVEVGLSLERLGTSSVVYRIALFGDGVLAATGRFVHVYVDRRTERPVDVPEVIRRAVSALGPAPELPPDR